MRVVAMVAGRCLVLKWQRDVKQLVPGAKHATSRDTQRSYTRDEHLFVCELFDVAHPGTILNDDDSSSL